MHICTKFAHIFWDSYILISNSVFENVIRDCSLVDLRARKRRNIIISVDFPDAANNKHFGNEYYKAIGLVIFR